MDRVHCGEAGCCWDYCSCHPCVMPLETAGGHDGGIGEGGGGGGALRVVYFRLRLALRSGGRDASSANDFGEFDSEVGGGYGGGAIFLGDSQRSGSLGGMSAEFAHGNRMSWRGRGERVGGGGGQGSSSPNTEKVKLKWPLLNASESPLKGVPPPARSVPPPPARGGRGRFFTGASSLAEVAAAVADSFLGRA